MNWYAISLAFVAFLLSGAAGIAPQASAASGAVPVSSASSTSLSNFDDDFDPAHLHTADPSPLPRNGPVVRDALPQGGGCQGDGGGSETSSTAGAVALLSQLALPSPEFALWTATPAPPFVRSSNPSGIYEPPRA